MYLQIEVDEESSITQLLVVVSAIAASALVISELLKSTHRRAVSPAGTLSAVTERTLVLDQARRRQAAPDRRDSRPDRAQGPDHCGPRTASNVSDELARAHYAEHDGKPFFDSLLEFITSGPVVAAIVEGPRADCRVSPDRRRHRSGGEGRSRHHPRRPGLVTQDNLVHGSDSPGVRRPRDRALVPGPYSARRCQTGPARRATADVGY